MGKYGKWLGGALGWTFGGPIGGLIGFAIGSVFDGVSVGGVQTTTSTAHNDFAVSLLVMSAAVMKADGKTMRSEVDFVKRFYVQQFGVDATQEYMQLLKKLLVQDIPVNDVCMQIRSNLDYSARLLLLQYLYGIANADGDVHKSEIDLIQQMSVYLGISPQEHGSILAMFVKIYDDPYKVLEISADASVEEIKKSYRKMALTYHPDKVLDLGMEHQHAAKEKFQKVQDAYDRIKKERGIK